MEDRARTDEAPGARGYLSIYLKGTFMGAADAVPGVSGGTIALIVGVYERLIGAITALDPRVLEYVPRLHTREGRAEFSRALVAMDVPFLVALGGGVLTSLLLISGAMHVAVVEFPVPTFAFFFGLIAASAIILRDEVFVDTPARVGAGVAGFAIAFAVSGVAESAIPSTLPVLFVAGAIAITAMILPGISGSFLLLLLGQYNFMTGVAKELPVHARQALGGTTAPLVDTLTVVGTFGVGAVIGLFTIAHVVKYALEHYHEATLTFLVALMLGALRVPVRKVGENVVTWSPTVVATVLVAAVVGGGLVLGLDYVTDDIDY
jgi:putative membrane protein